MRKQFPSTINRLVVKVGSSILSSDSGKLDESIVEKIVGQVASIAQSGKEVIIVSSGAIPSGISELGAICRPEKISCLQATAAIGQSILMQNYMGQFKKKGLSCAQVLLTWDDFQVRTRYLNAKNTILSLLEYKAIPIINENDAVSTEEIKFGDNDRLSALVASLIEADLLLLLSDVDGLYRGKSKELVSLVEEIDSDIEKLARDTTRKNISKGGMISKLESVSIAAHSQIPSVITNGKTDDVITKVLKGEEIGTLFMPKKSRMVAKKRWLAFGVKSSGKIVVDDGAKEALVKGNKSLLCPGILDAEGLFNAGDIIAIMGKDGKEIAKGRVNFSKEEIMKMKGCRVAKEAVHRNNLVITLKEI
ncbi:glutamate 5-kinase [Candidatus Omnitrophota bacterium]